MSTTMVIPDFSDASVWLSLLTLTFLEIVLGVDNIIFISILSGRLSRKDQKKARTIGLLFAMLLRIGLLLTITHIMQLKESLFTMPLLRPGGKPLDINWKDLILMAGGIFLVVKSTLEIHHKLENPGGAPVEKSGRKGIAAIVFQIVLIDAVFSFDSILTAIGLVKEVFIMIIAVVISILLMIRFSGRISRFINGHPTLQMLALSFLIVIGVMLVAEGFHQEISKSYIYTMIAFSLLVELLNMRLRKRTKDVERK